MIEFDKCRKLFIDFDGVIVDSNKFKELAIKRSIYKLMGKNKISTDAINYFNINAGVSRFKKLSLFYKNEDIKNILDLYSEQCRLFFMKASPTKGLKKFLEYIKNDKTILERYPLEKISKIKKLGAFKHHNNWQCMDTIRDKTLLEQLVKKKIF